MLRKLNILITNAESMVFRQDFNYINPTYNHNDMHPLQGLYYSNCHFILSGHGVEAIPVGYKKVYRILPYDTSARSFWGEFRRCSMNPRIIDTEVNYIIECEMDDEDSGKIDGVSRIKGLMYRNLNSASIENHYSRMKHPHFNLDTTLTMAPKLSDYSENNNFKYYTLLV
jgi:hypothetical protein